MPSITKLVAVSLSAFFLAACSGEDQPTGTGTGSQTGQLEVLVANHGTYMEPSYFLNVDDGTTLELVFAEYPGLVTGDRIAVDVAPTGDGRFLVNHFELEPSDTVPPDGVGQVQEGLTGQTISKTPRVALLLVNWTAPSSTYGVTNARSDLIDSTTSVRAHFLESSYGKMGITGDAFGWYTIAAPNGCDYRAIRDRAIAAAQNAGVVLTNFDHVAIVFPRFSTCTWGGLGEQGSPNRNARYTWYNGPSKSVISHELGHNFGMYHARSYSCGSSRIAEPSSCSFVEYGDVTDPMGRGGQAHFSAYQKKMQSWYGKCNIVNAPSGGTFDIVPIEGASDSVQAVQVPMASGLCPPGDSPGMQGCQYVLEYRTQASFDSRLNPGVYLHATSRAAAPAPGTSGTTATNPFLLDMTPTTPGNFADAALAVGATFSDPNGIAIKVVSVSSSKATVQVTLPGGSGAATCLDGTTFGSSTTPTCTDAVKNGTETDVDCGGSCTADCANGKTCSVAGDCSSGICTSGICQAPATASCTDAVKNGTETDVDCGGSCTADCANGKTCSVAGDCSSGICTSGICQAPATASCTDGVKNGTETDVDCGGSCTANCANGKLCAGAGDCISGICTSGVCQAPATASCTDGVKNGTETDVDCGGSCTADCANGKLCSVAGDCSSGICTSGTCRAPTTGTVTATIAITDNWDTGYCANVTVTNNGTTTINSWKAVIDLHQAAQSGGWNATLSVSGSLMTATPVDWNAKLAPGGTGPWGYCANKTGSNWQPTVSSVTAL